MSVRQSRALAGVGAAALCVSSGLSFVSPNALPTRGTAVATSSVSAELISVPVTTAAQSSVSSVGVFCVAAAAGAAAGVSAARGAKRQTRSVKSAARVAQAAGKIVVIAGPPAAGKGTQCEKIKEKYGYVHISTGDILRANVKEGTELGKKAKEFMDAGALVPSELIVDLVKDRLAQDDAVEKGVLLDGFPRAPDQAKAMVDAGIKVDKFVVIEVPDDTLVERGCGRRLDPETGDIYHMKFKPPPADIVERLVHRSDDQEEAIRNRLSIYHEQVDGIIPYFKKECVKIDGTGKPDEVWEIMKNAID